MYRCELEYFRNIPTKAKERQLVVTKLFQYIEGKMYYWRSMCLHLF